MNWRLLLHGGEHSKAGVVPIVGDTMGHGVDGATRRHFRNLRRAARPLRRRYQMARERMAAPLLRLRMGMGTDPLARGWFARGLPVHRYYTERFLAAHGAEIHGHCLEFQEDSYTTRFSSGGITKLDILHIARDPRAPQATIFADLTRENDMPSNAFDCIICTYVLHVVYQAERMVAELHRILRPGGVLFVAVPNITIGYPEFPELWRFTPQGLARLLESTFGSGNVQASSYGNSLTAAGELRGLAVRDFSQAELDVQDPRFGLVSCARAVKGKID